MFNYEEYRNGDWADKIQYISRMLNLTKDQLAHILEIEVGETTTGTQSIQEFLREALAAEGTRDKVRLINILFNYLAALADRTEGDLGELWKRTHIYADAISKPPWVPEGLDSYLMNNQVAGLARCIDWIRR